MKYRNSQIYVQKQIDKLLYEYKHFVKTYVDNIIMFFQSLKTFSSFELNFRFIRENERNV